MAQIIIVADGDTSMGNRDTGMNSNFTELYARTTGTGIVIDEDKFFIDETARNAYFTGLIPTGQQVAILVADETYIIQQYDGIEWVSIATGVRVDNSVYPLLSFWTINEAGELEYSGVIRVKNIITAPGSVKIGDTVVSSGGRIISARSETTGNLGAFLIQLYGPDNYQDATIYDKTQMAQLFDVQVLDDSEQSGITETIIKQVVQNDIQLMKVRFKPVGGVVANDFNFEVRMAVDGEPIYSELVKPSELVDIGGGVFEFSLINPSQFDTPSDAIIHMSGISLLGGIGYDGTDTIRFGDSTKNYFFPWLQTYSIPIIRKKIATEEWVNENKNVFGTEFEVFESMAQSVSGYNWTEKINETTGVKPIGKYRVGFSCEVAEDGNSQEVRFLIDGLPIHNHTLGNDELEPTLSGNNWDTVMSTTYINITTPRAINVNIQHKDSGTGAMSNAIIEIWRVS